LIGLFSTGEYKLANDKPFVHKPGHGQTHSKSTSPSQSNPYEVLTSESKG